MKTGFFLNLSSYSCMIFLQKMQHATLLYDSKGFLLDGILLVVGKLAQIIILYVYICPTIIHLCGMRLHFVNKIIIHVLL